MTQVEQSCQKCLEISEKLDKFETGFHNLCQGLYRNGVYKEAVPFVKFYNDLTNDWSGFELLGDIYAKLGDHELAMKNYEQALKLMRDVIDKARKEGSDYQPAYEQMSHFMIPIQESIINLLKKRLDSIQTPKT